MDETKKPRALVIDDSRMERLYLSRILEKLGLEAECADGGESGLKLLPGEAGKGFDILFIDHMMPNRDGLRTLEAIRKHEEKNGEAVIPAVVLGRREELEAGGRYQKVGFSGLLEKPVEWEKLLEVLQELLPEEKQQMVQAPEMAQQQVEEEAAALPDWLMQCPGIDTEEGVKNCGSEDGFMSALGIFYSTIHAKADEIEGYYQSEDWENYTIKVHALKSSARIIGAMELSGLARKMEDAGNAGDLSAIRENTEKLLADYRAYMEALSKMDGDSGNEEELPEAPPAKIADAYQAIQMFAGDMDFDMLEMVQGQMKEFRLPPEDKEAFSRIQDAMANLDWDKITEIAGQRLEGIAV